MRSPPFTPPTDSCSTTYAVTPSQSHRRRAPLDLHTSSKLLGTQTSVGKMADTVIIAESPEQAVPGRLQLTIDTPQSVAIDNTTHVINSNTTDADRNAAPSNQSSPPPPPINAQDSSITDTSTGIGSPKQLPDASTPVNGVTETQQPPLYTSAINHSPQASTCTTPDNNKAVDRGMQTSPSTQSSEHRMDVSFTSGNGFGIKTDFTLLTSTVLDMFRSKAIPSKAKLREWVGAELSRRLFEHRSAKILCHGGGNKGKIKTKPKTKPRTKIPMAKSILTNAAVKRLKTPKQLPCSPRKAQRAPTSSHSRRLAFGAE